MARRKNTKRSGDSGQHGYRPGFLDRTIRAAAMFVLWLGFRVGAVIALMLAFATGYFYNQLPEADELLDGRSRGSVTLLDRHGQVFAWRGAQYGGALRAAEASPHLVNAILAAEDRRFRGHWGIDPRGLIRAMVANVRAGRLVQGGSTLTQQVAKNVFLTQERSIDRKIKELPVALALELKYTKDEILSIYLNRVYLGAGTYGFEAASKRYFGKSAREVNPAEAAMLAGLLKAPSRFAPTSDLARSRGRASVILNAMVEEGYLTDSERLQALASPASLSNAAAKEKGRYFADWVMEAGPGYLTHLTTEDVRILTTFDPEIQTAAEGALRDVFESKVKPNSTAQAAIVIMSPDGAVRAMVGGRSYGGSQFNRATQALRQPGSSFKPIVYAAGLEAGLSPDSVIDDAPITIKKWSPRNYGGTFAGPVTLRTALAKSINTVAVRVSEQSGRESVRKMAARLGLTGDITPGPSVALGVSEATLLDMTGVYAIFANRGGQATPHGVRQIILQGAEEPLMASFDQESRQILSTGDAGRLTSMMAGVIAQGTGMRAQLPDRPAAGKTGTTQGARDAWFIGYTADLVAGVWMGKDDNEPLTGVTGGGLPAEIWREAMLRAHDGLPIRPLQGAPASAAPPVVIAATPEPVAPKGDDVLVQSIFKQVAEALSEGSGSGPTPGWEPQTADR